MSLIVNIFGMIAGLMMMSFLGTPIIIYTLPVFLVFDVMLWLIFGRLIIKKNERESSVSERVAVMYLGRTIGSILAVIISPIIVYLVQLAVSSGLIKNLDLFYTVAMYSSMPIVISFAAKIGIAAFLNSYLEDDTEEKGEE